MQLFMTACSLLGFRCCKCPRSASYGNCFGGLSIFCDSVVFYEKGIPVKIAKVLEKYQ